MVLNSMVVLTVARVSAEAWQWASCIGNRESALSSEQMLDLICCFPFHQLSRFALCLCSFFCLPQPDSYYPYSYFPSSDSDDSDDSSDYYYHSHSD
ncbi:uncharacterized protein LOC113858643 [Abrus precatorius]|uniref:Uncharacterized protein LOC113858643 n=1 Tax=Abrus precatorius TaxID=3816 RepID=A0A8B8KTF6_ABRPR|nr:uncharacterized protein LOC113858643 [Abrus precatorius]XP_027347162.1 uncharacterized protein LOC113858643 [Abrus precatorius]